MNNEYGRMPSALSKRHVTGRQGEQAALEHLERHGYTIIGRNWRCRSGELDLIATEGDRIVFVEVRSRRSVNRFGTPLESVDVRKQLQVRATAQVFLRARGLEHCKIRFDVIAVIIGPGGEIAELKHIEGAF
ncbi:YraN family protein [Paenibacillus cisolokensis]|uniref:YraN family protein n=1 Tax=Paenibacillus cisolokensis TaxID=1658519 RepID=UPI003D278B4B